MKKKKQYRTNYFLDKHNVVDINKKINSLLVEHIPDSVMVMLGQGVETSIGIKFYNRYTLIPKERNNYTIYDENVKTAIYDHVALFESAIRIIYHLNRTISTPCPTYEIIYGLDQEYYRCLADIKFYKDKINKQTDNYELYSTKLLDKYKKLSYIKQRLSKVY